MARRKRITTLPASLTLLNAGRKADMDFQSLLVMSVAIGGVTFSCAPQEAGGSNCKPSLDWLEPNQDWLEPTPWKEPNTPAIVPADDRTEVPASGELYSLHFPAESNAGVANLSYWLTSDEDLSVDLTVGIAADQPEVESLRVVLLIDGIQSELANKTGASSILQIPVRPGQLETTSFGIPGGSIVEGAHSVDILTSSTDRRPAFGGFSFTALKGSSAFSRREDLEVTTEKAPRNAASQIRGPGLSWFLESGESKVPLPNGSVPMNVFLAPSLSGDCVGVAQRIVLIALLDGVQIAIGDLGVRPSVLLEDGQVASFDTTITDLPMDGKAHALELWTLSGDGAFSEESPGKSSPEQGYPQRLHVTQW